MTSIMPERSQAAARVGWNRRGAASDMELERSRTDGPRRTLGRCVVPSPLRSGPPARRAVAECTARRDYALAGGSAAARAIRSNRGGAGPRREIVGRDIELPSTSEAPTKPLPHATAPSSIAICAAESRRRPRSEPPGGGWHQARRRRHRTDREGLPRPSGAGVGVRGRSRSRKA